MTEALKKIKCFLLDLDGTVYLSGKPIEGAKEAIAHMRKRGQVIFVTNNSSRSQKDYVAKLSALKVFESGDKIYTSGMCAIDFLKANKKADGVFLLGNDILREEFEESGITLKEHGAKTVVLAFDTTLNYQKLCIAAELLNSGTYYVATHPDLVCPTQNGSIPDAGSFAALLKAATGREPDVVCGKPHSEFANGVIAFAGERLCGNQIAMFGDRLYTDMAFATNNGFVPVLVLSGEATRKSLEQSGLKIPIILNSLADFPLL